MIVVSGLDMAAWDALARAATCRSPSFSVARLRLFPPTTANGLWLTPVDELGEEPAALLTEGHFQGLKLRLGRKPSPTTSPPFERCAARLARTSS